MCPCGGNVRIRHNQRVPTKEATKMQNLTITELERHEGSLRLHLMVMGED